MEYPIPQYFDEFSQFLRTQGKAEGTIQGYIFRLQRIDKDIEAYFANPDLRGKHNKVAAYRAYCRFLTIKKDLKRSDLMDILDTIKPPKKRGNNHSDRKWSIPKIKWVKHIRKAPNRIAKMGMWLGFHFGLRLSEIVHLRIQDINFKDQLILIRPHIKTKNQKAWHPKYHRERQLPFTKDQEDTLKRWITKIRPIDLPHPYLLWTIKGKRKKQIVMERSFQRWCTTAGLTAHILRYSFATHYYNESKDVKLISDLLGYANVSTTSEYLQFAKKETMSKGRQLFAQA